jgi:hypothetical protein
VLLCVLCLMMWLFSMLLVHKKKFKLVWTTLFIFLILSFTLCLLLDLIFYVFFFIWRNFFFIRARWWFFFLFRRSFESFSLPLDSQQRVMKKKWKISVKNTTQRIEIISEFLLMKVTHMRTWEHENSFWNRWQTLFYL